MKYIIDIPDDRIGDFVGSTHLLMPYIMAGHKGHHDTGLKLIPYTEPDRKAIEDAQGEAWELARKIANMRHEEFSKCFDVTDDYCEFNIMDIMSYSEAKAKYEAWKKQKAEIRVGDELEDDGNIRAVVLDILDADYESYEVITENGIVDEWQKGIVVKTGRHFDEVEELLKKMKEESE